MSGRNWTPRSFIRPQNFEKVYFYLDARFLYYSKQYYTRPNLTLQSHNTCARVRLEFNLTKNYRYTKINDTRVLDLLLARSNTD